MFLAWGACWMLVIQSTKFRRWRVKRSEEILFYWIMPMPWVVTFISRYVFLLYYTNNWPDISEFLCYFIPLWQRFPFFSSERRYLSADRCTTETNGNCKIAQNSAWMWNISRSIRWKTDFIELHINRSIYRNSHFNDTIVCPTIVTHFDMHSIRSIDLILLIRWFFYEIVRKWVDWATFPSRSERFGVCKIQIMGVTSP